MEGTIQTLQTLAKQIGIKKAGIKTIIEKNFNAKTGKEKGGVMNIEEEKMEKRGRQSKDGNVNKESSLLVNFIEERGWMYLNRNTKGNEKKEYTFTGGISVVQ